MNPKKANKLYKPVAEELNVSEALVEDFVEFFYKDVRTCLSNLQHPLLYIDGLGTFTIKHKMVLKRINVFSEYVIQAKTFSFKDHQNKKLIEEHLEKLKSVQVLISEQFLKKEKIKNKKNEEHIKRNLEKPETNI